MTVKPTMFCLALVFFLTRLTQTEAKRVYPLGVKLVNDFTCESVPNNNLSCDIKVLNGTGAGIKMAMDQTYIGLQGLKGLGANETCIEAIQNSTCLDFPRCERERLYVDINVASEACDAGRKVCPKVISDYTLNCTAKRERYKQSTFNATVFKCKNIEDSTGTCPNITYKFAEIPGSKGIQGQFLSLKKNLQSIKPNVTSECYKKVQTTLCLLTGVICSADETIGVSFISKQECNKTLQCLPEMSDVNGTKYHPSSEMCDHLPDESTGIDEPNPTEKPVKTENPVNNVTSNKPTHVVIVLLLFTARILFLW